MWNTSKGSCRSLNTDVVDIRLNASARKWITRSEQAQDACILSGSDADTYSAANLTLLLLCMKLIRAEYNARPFLMIHDNLRTGMYVFKVSHNKLLTVVNQTVKSQFPMLTWDNT